MALFGNKAKEEEMRLEEERIQAEKKAIEKRFKEQFQVNNNLPGVIAKIHGKDFKNGYDYKLWIEEGKLCIIESWSSCLVLNTEQMKEYLSMQKVEVDLDLCEKEVVPIEEKSVTKSDSIYGECLYEVDSIRINIKHDDGIFRIEINNFNQDFLPIKALINSIQIKNYYNIVNIPSDNFLVDVMGGMNYLAKSQYISFRENGKLFFVRRIKRMYKTDNVAIASIAISDILYYRSVGSLRYEQQISGGGGMGVNYTGAAIGGLLFGGAGAIIGSRHNEEIKSIESRTVEKDTRLVILSVRIDDVPYQIGFDINSEDAFDWLIPEKQYDYVISKRRAIFEKEQ